MVGFSSVINDVKTKAVSYSEGLRRYMLGVYNYMSLALGISALTAFFMAKTGLSLAIMSTPLGWIIAFSPLIISIVMSVKFTTAKISTIKGLFFAYSILMGMSLSSIFYVYSGVDITKTFLITACMFLGMSIYGYTTQKDLSTLGSIFIMAVWGILIASIVNIFLHSSGMSFAISCISVLVFTGLVAYDTQSLKRTYYAVCHDNNLATKFGIFGALQLYIDFIAIFVHLLQLFANSQRRD